MVIAFEKHFQVFRFFFHSEGAELSGPELKSLCSRRLFGRIMKTMLIASLGCSGHKHI